MQDKIRGTLGDGNANTVIGEGIEQKTERTGDQQFNFTLGQGRDLTELIFNLSGLLHELKATVTAETRLQSQRIEVLEKEQRLQDQRLAILERVADHENNAIVVSRRIGAALVIGLFALTGMVAVLAYLIAY